VLVGGRGCGSAAYRMSKWYITLSVPRRVRGDATHITAGGPFLLNSCVLASAHKLFWWRCGQSVLPLTWFYSIA